MRRSAIVFASLVAVAAIPLADAASLQCTTDDKSTWLPTATIKKMLQEHGFTAIGTIKPNDGNCYVVQATDQSGATKTLYLDPTDGALMGME